MMEGISNLIRQALREDAVNRDITSNTLIDEHLKAKTAIIARASGVAAGLFIIYKVYQLIDKGIRVKVRVKEGVEVKKGEVLAEIYGNARAILSGERTCLNFVQRVSGIATYTRKFVSEIADTKTKILDTRKTVPGWRMLDKYSVKTGGGTNHRLDLAEMFLIKDNHRKLVTLPKIVELMPIIKSYRKSVEIEVNSLEELKQVLPARTTMVMLDNMGIEDIKKAVAIVKRLPSGQRPLLEVSGGVTLKNVHDIAKTGVDFISVGALTHSTPAMDISMDVQ